MRYLITAYALNIIDYIFTAHWVHKFGIEIEANPIGQWMFSHNVVWVYKILIVGGLFAPLGYLMKKCPSAVISAKILLSVYGLITLYHVVIAIYIAFII